MTHYSLAESCSLRLSLTWPVLCSTVARCRHVSDTRSCSSRHEADPDPACNISYSDINTRV